MLFVARAACPANCIYIEAAEEYGCESDLRRASAMRPFTYRLFRAVFFCGYCVEAMSTDAITHGPHGFELATYDINALVYRKEQMLEKDILPKNPPLINVQLELNLLVAGSAKRVHSCFALAQWCASS